MTAKEVTEKAARITYPGLPQEAIKRIAVAIWNASPTGELWHVQQLAAMLDIPDAPVAEYVKTQRNVQAVADEWGKA